MIPLILHVENHFNSLVGIVEKDISGKENDIKKHL